MGQTMNLQLQSTLPTNLQSVRIIDYRNVLPFNPKYTWERLKGNRDINDLKTIVLHHDAWPKKISEKYTDATLATKIALDHIASKKNRADGDAGFPYDAWVRNGTVYIGNEILPTKYGVSSNNSYTVHLCVSGDYANHDQLTDDDRNALYAAIFLYRGMMPAYEAIKGHQELSPSQCPGYDYKQVRSDIAGIDAWMEQQAEQQEYEKTQSAVVVAAFSAYQRIGSLWTNYQSEKWKIAAETKLMWLADVTGCDNPKAIYERVTDLYNKAQEGKWSGEAIRKLQLISEVMKARGLL